MALPITVLRGEEPRVVLLRQAGRPIFSLAKHGQRLGRVEASSSSISPASRSPALSARVNAEVGRSLGPPEALSASLSMLGRFLQRPRKREKLGFGFGNWVQGVPGARIRHRHRLGDIASLAHHLCFGIHEAILAGARGCHGSVHIARKEKQPPRGLMGCCIESV